jgi:TonB family protein
MKFPRLAGLSFLIAPIIAAGATQFAEHSSAVLQRNPGRDTVDCLDTLHASDSLIAIVTMSMTPQDRKAKLPPDFEGLFIQEFRSRLKVPDNLPLSVVLGWSPCDSASHKCVGGALVLGSQAYATAHPGGTLSRIVTIDFALTPTLSDSVRAALQKLSDEKMVPFFTQPDSIPLDISIHVEQHSDTVPRYRHLFRTKIPHYALQFSEAAWPKNVRGPRYPRIAEQSGVSDSVVMTFTILSDGTVAAQSVDVHSGHYTDFIRAALDRMATMRYVPGRVGSCPVATWKTQTFLFQAH